MTSVDQTELRNALVPSQPDGVDGGTAPAAPELPRPPVRPRDRPKTGLPDRPRAAKAVDAIRGTVVFARTVLLTSIPRVRLAAIPPKTFGIDVSRRSGRYPFPRELVRLELRRPSMHAGRDGIPPDAAARVRVRDATGAVVGGRVDE